MKLIKRIYIFFDKKIIVPITKFFVNIGEKIKKASKPLETISKTKSGTIIFSLLIAVAIFLIVDRASTTLLETNAKVLYNQPVNAIYNNEEYVVTGLPKTADLTMIGSRANLYLAKQLSSQNITVDLSDLKVGTHQVELKYKQSISNVEYKLDPSTITVTIKNKQSLTKDISEEVINLDKLNSKYSIKDITLTNPVNKKTDKDEDKEEKEEEISNVVVKGDENQIKEVAIVKALINVDNLSNDVKTGNNKISNVPLIAYNDKGQKVDVELVPSTVTAILDLESTSKEVPINVKINNLENVMFGKAIREVEKSVDKVTIYGTAESLENITKVDVNIDIPSDMKSDKEYTKTIKKPKGVRDISTKTINIKVKLGDEVSTELSGVRLSYKNLDSSKYSVQATQDSTTEISVILKGVKDVISNITATDIDAYVDLKDLTAGEHEVDVVVSGSDNKVIYTPKVTKVKILIIEK